MIWKRNVCAAVGLIAGLASAASAVECSDKTHKNTAYTICKVDAGQAEIRLFLNNPQTGQFMGSFAAVNDVLSTQGKTLAMAMNAGMYHRDRSPVGLYVENGKEVKSVVSKRGPGNFGMVPNGVFCLRNGRADVIETKTFIAEKPACRDATQSGPMLVINGALHPRFLPNSDSRYIRNGVGTSQNGKVVYFAISNRPVTFHEFGTLFRDVLKTPNALYFDGNISRLYAPKHGRNDLGFPMGPIVGVVVPKAGD